MRYLPKSERTRKEMLAAVGVSSVDELFACIPEKARLGRALELPAALSEPEIVAYFRARAEENAGGKLRLLGAGVYDHFRPVLIDALLSRGEFFTAYTPYQAEIAQGTLQSIFEFQTLLCQLTGQEVANASMYDGSTALPESVAMALRVTKNRSRVLVPRSLHPEYRAVLHTYARSQDIEVAELPVGPDGCLDREALSRALDDKTAAVAVQSPNFFGCLEDVPGVAEQAHASGALLIAVVTEAVSLGVLRPPAEADIVALEGQSLGLPISYGGPWVGVIASKEKFVRNLPGRLVGQTTDEEGRRGFVLALATREQHIRREKATSNICTNQALCALAATIFMTVMGKEGLRALAEQNLAKAHYLAGALEQLPGVRRTHSAPFFNEFAVTLDGKDPAAVQERLREKDIIAGVALRKWYPELKAALLLCATEIAGKDDLDRFVQAFKDALGS